MQTTAYIIDLPSAHPWLGDGGAHWPHGDCVPISDQQIAYDPSVALDVWQYPHGSVVYDAYGYSEMNEQLLDGPSASNYGAPVLPTLAIASDGAYDPPPHDCHWDQQMSCLPDAYYHPAEHALQYASGLLSASPGADSCYPSLDGHNHPSLDDHNHTGVPAHRANHARPSSAPHCVYPHYEDELAHAHGAHAHIRPRSSHGAYHPALTDWDHDPRHQVLAIPAAASASKSASGASRRSSSSHSHSHSHAHGQGQNQNQDEPHRRPLTLACLFCRKRKIACGSPPPGAKDRTCNQCARRNLKCVYPEGSRRGMRSKLLYAQDALALQPIPISVS